jgi:CPA1 family monovalent cation:H+ antiporter
VSTFDFGAGLLVLAAVVGVVNDRTLRLPRPVALLLASLAISASIIGTTAIFGHTEMREYLRVRIIHAHLPQILLDGFLALLLFAGSLHVDARDLRRRAWPVFVLATLGVVLATGMFGAGIWAALWLVGIPVPPGWCLAIGAVLAPTDAVAVEGLLSRVKLPPGLRAIIAGESLFNDGAAVVLFGAAVALAAGRTDVVGHGRLAVAILVECTGGVALGATAGYLTFLAIRFTRDDFLRLTISLALVLLTYRGAVVLGISGPVAVVTAGLVFNHRLARAPPEEHSRASLSGFWSLIDDLLNTLLYLFVGFELLAIGLSWRALSAILIAVPLALLARLASVGAPMLVLRLRVPTPARALGILTWAGLRGGVSIALALILPPSAYRDLLLAICFGVVIFTVVVQGLLLPRVVTALYGPPRSDRTADRDAAG